MSDGPSLEQRVQRLEDRDAIRELVARYSFVVDDRDVAALADCFTEDGRFRSADGVMDARGRAAIVEQYHGRFAVLSAGVHLTHDQTIDFDADDPDRATGVVACTAELVREGRAQLANLRYYDEYRRDGDGRWRFADRLIRFFYYLDAATYARDLVDSRRVRTYGEPAAGELPESLPTWQRYYAERPRRRGD